MRVFGEIKGSTKNDIFTDRRALAKAGIHKPTQKGISGSQSEGADSIVLSGGYQDDQDFGDEIIYTGSRGRDANTGKQIANQELTYDNLALAKSKIERLPVRVTRSHKHKSPYSPLKGYQYAGLYYVEDVWMEKGKSGFYVCRFRLIQEPLSISNTDEKAQEIKSEPTKRVKTTVLRIVRDTRIAKKVKEKHGFKCQVCSLALETKAGLYAEAAHIRPLGSPHNGPDIEANLLCLCPNHHVLFDNGGFTINDDLSLNGIKGQLITRINHEINLSFIQYHREHYGNDLC